MMTFFKFLNSKPGHGATSGDSTASDATGSCIPDISEENAAYYRPQLHLTDDCCICLGPCGAEKNSQHLTGPWQSSPWQYPLESEVPFRTPGFPKQGLFYKDLLSRFKGPGMLGIPRQVGDVQGLYYSCRVTRCHVHTVCLYIYIYVSFIC